MAIWDNAVAAQLSRVENKLDAVARRRTERGLAEEVGRRGGRLDALRDALLTPQERALRRLVGAMFRQRVFDRLEGFRRHHSEALARVGFVDRFAAFVGILTAAVRAAALAAEAYNDAFDLHELEANRAYYAGRDEVNRREGARAGWEHDRKTEGRDLVRVRQAVEAGRPDVLEAFAAGRVDEVRLGCDMRPRSGRGRPSLNGAAPHGQERLRCHHRRLTALESGDCQVITVSVHIETLRTE